MIFTLVPTAWAEDTEGGGSKTPPTSGYCGAVGNENNVQWAMTQNNEDSENPTYTLTISGNGAMMDYNGNITKTDSTQPWRADKTGVAYADITNVVVTSGVTNIGAFAFNGLNAVKVYDIANTVTEIKAWGLDTQSAVTFEMHENANFPVVDGVLFNFNEGGTTLIAYPGGSAVRDEYTVPSTVTAISDGAFVGCPIKKLTIGNNVKTVLPSWSFNGGVLEELDVNCSFGRSTFAQITTLKRVTLGDSIKEIPQMAFLNCTELQTVSIPSGLTKIGSQAFFGCSSLQNVTLPASLKEIGYQAFRDCDALTSITFPDSLETVGDQAFFITTNGTNGEHTGSLTTVTFGTKVPTFLNAKGEPSNYPQLFTGQNQLKTVDMSRCTDTVISAGLFSGLTALETIIFPTGLTEIGDHAFTNCSGLKSLEFPDSLTKIGESAFSGCTGLTYISYGNGIDDIGSNAFGGCTGVKVIDLHRATKIGEKYDNGSHADNSDLALTHACIRDAKKVKYYLRTVDQANSVKGNLEWGDKGAGTGNTTNTYYVLKAIDAVPDYTGQTDKPTRAGYTFSQWEAVTVSQGSTTKNVYTDAHSWSLTSLTVTVSPASVNTYVGDAVTLIATVSEPVDGFTYSYQWYSNTSNSTEGGTAISEAASATYSPNITAGTTYYYCVVTVTNGSDTTSATTAVVPVTVASQAGSVTISNNKTAATYGDKPFTFTYEASKAATVTSSNPSVATVRDNNGTVTVTIVGAGTTEISVSFDADTDYSAASDKFTLTVNKATPTVSIIAEPASLVGGGTVKLTVTTDAPTEVVPTCEGVTVTPTGNGTYSAVLPNETRTYTFTAAYDGDANHARAEKTCTVSVTAYYVPGAPTYPATAPAAPNGTVTVTPSNASKGTNVTVTVKPNEGYELGSLAVKDASGNLLPLADLGNGKFSFVMPDGKVSVEAEFVKTASTSFADVPANAYFADAVKWAVDKGITNGLSDTMFGPYESCTRAQIVTFLWRAAGSPEPTSTSTFADVPVSAYYAKAVAWAVENGITNGMTETTFAPDATCTRGQSVTFLHRALKGTASGSANFTDVKSDAFYADAINWAVANNVTNGTSNTTFSPNADCTRAEIVTFLYRAYQGK